jgi:hypothetical protein
MTSNLRKQGESFDKFLFGLILSLAFATFVASILISNRKILFFSYISWTPLFIYNIVQLEHEGSWNYLWLGFGGKVAILLILVSIFIKVGVNELIVSHPFARIMSLITLCFILIVGLASFFQSTGSLIDYTHSWYILNEIYAISSNNFPYDEFIPQYQTFLSWGLSPVVQILSPAESLRFIILFLTLLSFSIILISIALIICNVGKNSHRVVFIPAIFGFLFITQGPSRVGLHGSIAGLHSAFPVRMLLPMCMAILLVKFVNNSMSKKIAFTLGAVSGFSIYTQTDFGLAGTFSIIFAIALVRQWKIDKESLKFALYLGVGIFLGFLILPLVQILLGKSFKVEFFGWFIRQFSSGVGSESIQYPGPGLILVTICVAMFVLNSFLALKFSNSASVELKKIHALGVFFASFTLAAMPYYLNRSYVSGQLQSLLLPLALSIVFMYEGLVLQSKPEKRFSNLNFASLIILALPISSLYLLPSPTQEVNRIQESIGEPDWLQRNLPNPETISSLAIKFPRISYFGIMGNYLESTSGIENATIFNSPTDANMSSEALKVACAQLGKFSGREVLFGPGSYSFMPNLQNGYNVCGFTYLNVESEGGSANTFRLITLN